MPYISVKTPFKVEEEKAEMMKTLLGKAIETIPGKTENWLMVSFNSQDHFFFSGDSGNIAMIEVSIFGKAEKGEYEDLTEKICGITKKVLNIPPDKTYIKYSEIDNWGWNGKNF